MNQETAQKILKQTKNGYNQIAEHFSATRVWPWKVMDSFFSYLKVGERVLDIGCGNGRLYQAIKDRNINYVGIDNSEELIKRAKKNYQLPIIPPHRDPALAVASYQLPEFIVADALELIFQDKEFNHVFMMAVLPHIPSDELQIKALENAYRVLKPGGFLFTTCWNFWQPKMFWKNFKNRIKNKNNYQGLGWQDFLIPWKSSFGEILSQRFYHTFTKKELKKLLEKAGFKIGKIFYEYKGEKSNWLKGFNLVVIAKK